MTALENRYYYFVVYLCVTADVSCEQAIRLHTLTRTHASLSLYSNVFGSLFCFEKSRSALCQIDPIYHLYNIHSDSV